MRIAGIVVVLGVAVLASPAGAGTVTYAFEGTWLVAPVSAPTTFRGTLTYGTLPTPVMAGPSDERYTSYAQEHSSGTPFMSWTLQTGSLRFGSDDTAFGRDEIRVYDGTYRSANVDMVQFALNRTNTSDDSKNTQFWLIFDDMDADRFTGGSVPYPLGIDADWRRVYIDLRYTDALGNHKNVGGDLTTVTVVPLPPAAGAGIALLAGLLIAKRARRRIR